MILRLLIAATLALLVLTAACGGDDDDPSATLGTPIGTKDATPEASAEPTDAGNGAPPYPADPTLDEELTEFSRGDLEATIEPGDRYLIDPIALANEDGEAPSCDNFLFDFSWQVTDPFPTDGVALTWLFNRSGDEVEVASGPSGEQGIGCGTLAATNGGAAPITVSIKYVVGGLP